jgi:hypothetical protein
MPKLTDPDAAISLSSSKRPALAAVFGLFLGPIGLLYVGLIPALTMLAVNLLVGALTVGYGLILTWPVCAFVGFAQAEQHNRAIGAH